MNKKKAIILVLLLAVIAAGWFFLRGKRSIEHIILISIDTCRADHLGCYGFPQEITPNIDALAARSTRFKNAVTPVTLTLPAHSSMFTGTIPPYHGVHDNSSYILGQLNTTLAEVLSDEGFITAGIASSFVLDPKLGIDQGFDTYEAFTEETTGLDAEHLAPGRRGEEVSKMACKLLTEHKDDKFFLFAHYFDCHTPYTPPEPFATRFKDDLYAGEVAYDDYCIGLVLDKLKELDIYDSSLIIILADHGEALGEHGESEHGWFVYEECVKVPLIIKLPGQNEGIEVDQTVGLIDILPTVCGLVGIEVPPDVKGKDLSASCNGEKLRAEDRYMYLETLMPNGLGSNSLLGVMDENWKYIQTTRPELYDIASDPDEANNLMDSDPKRARMMKEQLKLILEEQVRKSDDSSRVTLDAAARKRLESLGYIAGGSTADFSFDQGRSDPKDMIAFHEKYKATNMLFLKKQYDQAKAACSELIAEYPDNMFGHGLMGKITFGIGDMKEAFVHYSNAAAFASEKISPPEKNVIQSSIDRIAIIYSKQGEFDKAIKHWNKLLAMNPDHQKVHKNIGSALFKQGKYEQAVSYWKEALLTTPNDSEIYNNLAAAMVQIEKVENAIEYWNVSLEKKSNQPKLRNKLALVFYQQGNEGKAIEHWNKARELKPDWPRVLNDLAWVYSTSKSPQFYKPDAAVPLAQRACELTENNNPDFVDTLSVAFAAVGRYNEAIEAGKLAAEGYTAAGKVKEAEGVIKRLKEYEKQ